MKSNAQPSVASLLAALQVQAENNGNTAIEDYQEQIQKKLPLWELYAKDQTKLLNKGIQAFKRYDKTHRLDFLWMRLKRNEKVSKTKAIEDLYQYAIKAYEQENWDDAHAMFSFMVFLSPNHYRLYIYLGTTTEKLYGPANASLFYDTITKAFEDPELLFYAAECEMHVPNNEKAKNYLERAIKAFGDKQSDDMRQLKEEMKALLKTL